jgi:hypothetical protein
MQRREMLAQIGAVGTVGAIAGCLGGDSGDGPAANDGSGLSLDGEPTIETVGSDCQTAEEESSQYEQTSEGTMSYSGTIFSPDPCHTATIANWSVDDEAGEIALEIGISASDSDTVCMQCTGQLSYEGTMNYTGGSEPTVTITHVDSASDE